MSAYASNSAVGRHISLYRITPSPIRAFTAPKIRHPWGLFFWDIMLGIEIKTEPCRFKGIGDWPAYDDIRVLELGNWQYELLVGVHELIEAQLCKARGITPEIVDEFDKNFKGQGEPGDDPLCPYRKEHLFATIVEMMLCHELGINFHDYNIITNHIGAL